MANHLSKSVSLFLFILSISISDTEQLNSSEKETLLRIKHLLNSPSSLKSWKNNTDFCNSEPTPTLTLVCYEDSITQLHVIGNTKNTPRLPDNFSMDSLVTTLVKLPSLKVLKLVSLGLWGPLPGKFMHLSSLEILNLTSNFFEGQIPQSISLLKHIQTLILDSNNFTGRLPEGLGSLSSLAVLNVNNNSLYGSLPHSLGNLDNLRVLVLSNNKFSGELPDLSSLTNLQLLDLENNGIGPKFPILSEKIETVVLRKNKFTYGIAEEVQSFYHMKILDVSHNRFVGPFPMSLLSLPSIVYLDISENRLTGMMSENLSCNDDLHFVNLTANLLTGKLPKCLMSDDQSKKRVVLYGENCLENEGENQQPVSFCKNEALAVGILPRSHRRKQSSKVILGLSICGGVVGAIVLVCATILVVKKFIAKRGAQKPIPRYTEENAPTGYTSKFLKDARYITQAMKLGAVGLPAYRTFSLEELEEATNNFDTSTFMGEGSHGQMYRGQLRDGSYVAIRCLKLKRNQSTQHLMPHIEMISKLRHQHLVSSLGHCFEYYLGDSSVSRIFLIFEYVPNGTLRSWISERRVRRKLTWGQRIAAATGVAKGIQFLHTGIVPALVSNNIKITDVLVDQNLAAKISSYSLPLLSDHMGKDHLQNFLGGSKDLKRPKHQDKADIYNFGVVLLEIISGKLINSRNEVEVVKDQLQASIITDDTSKKSLIDPTVRNACSVESANTMIEICCRCLMKDPTERPSIEDILWNLQFAAQVQDSWRGDSQSSEGSPLSPMQKSSRLKLTINQ